MSSYGNLLKIVARVVGGTQPDATNKPYWFSGKDTGDSTGVSGLAGCWWPPPEVIGDTPVALVVPVGGKLLEPYPMQGFKQTEDEIHVMVLVGHADLPTMMAMVADFYDTVPSVFDSHMQLFTAANVYAANCHPPQVMEVERAGSTYAALDFMVLVERSTPVTYQG